MSQKSGRKMPKTNIQPCPLRSVISPSVNKMSRYTNPPKPIPHHTGASLSPPDSQHTASARPPPHHPAGMTRHSRSSSIRAVRRGTTRWSLADDPVEALADEYDGNQGAYQVEQGAAMRRDPGPPPFVGLGRVRSIRHQRPQR